jgi:SNF2 family DNA or RNA helicase
LDQIEIAFQNHNIQYTRMDGTLSARKRELAIKSFQEDPDIKVFMTTAGAGGVGLNLVEANYVFMMEPLYNPQKDQQAVDRVYRIGQKRKVIVTRLIMESSIEQRVQKIAERKARLGALCLSKTMSNEERNREVEEILEGFGVKTRSSKTGVEKE